MQPRMCLWELGLGEKNRGQKSCLEAPAEILGWRERWGICSGSQENQELSTGKSLAWWGLGCEERDAHWIRLQEACMWSCAPITHEALNKQQPVLVHSLRNRVLPGQGALPVWGREILCVRQKTIWKEAGAGQQRLASQKQFLRTEISRTSPFLGDSTTELGRYGRFPSKGNPKNSQTCQCAVFCIATKRNGGTKLGGTSEEVFTD